MIEVARANLKGFCSSAKAGFIQPSEEDSIFVTPEATIDLKAEVAPVRGTEVSPGFRTALELAMVDPEQPTSIQEPDNSIELKAAKEELVRLQEKNKALAEEIKQLKESAAISDPKGFFDMLERSMNVLATILDHEAIDSDSRNIARDLRVRPDELRHYLLKGKKTPLEAIEELRPLLEAATKKLSELRKPGAAEGKNDHRASLLLEKLELRSEIRIDQAMDIIDGDDGVKPNNAMTRRAMKRAAEMRPHKAIFVQSFPGGVGSILRRR